MQVSPPFEPLAGAFGDRADLPEAEAQSVRRIIEERVQIAEAFAAAFSLSIVTDFARKLEERCQLAEQSAKAFAVEAAGDALAASRVDAARLCREVSRTAEQRLADVARASEARAQVAEAAAKAYADVGLEALAKSIGAASRSILRTRKELAESIAALRSELAESQESLRLLEEVCALLDRLIIHDQANNGSHPLPVVLRAVPRNTGEGFGDLRSASVRIADDHAPSHHLLR